MPQDGPSFFPSPSLDHAVAGLGAGSVAVLCMHPLDLLKIKFQVATVAPSSGLGRHIYGSLKAIHARGGIPALYRGLGANIAGNASSWGLYFLFYTALKRHMADGDNERMTPGDFLLCSAGASAVTAFMTNPIWVVKVRMFTTERDAPGAYKTPWHGLSDISRSEGTRGLWRGTWLALFGVSNGALQFMAYEQMKKWGFAQKRKQFAKTGTTWTSLDDRLSNTAYTAMSGFSKVFALVTTYPYQVVRSRIQNDVTQQLYPNIRQCIAKTWTEGVRGFYRGLGTNLVRVLPGTCVTLVVYENLAYWLRREAIRRESRN